MEETDNQPSYGTSRERGANVSYAEVERAALEILSSGHRPSMGTIRRQLGRGSPPTILKCLKRFWRDLGTRAQGDPAALTRLPAEISEAVDTIWQRALTLASRAANDTENESREHLERLRIANEVREQSLSAREKEYETQARERERALADSRSHLLSTLRMLETDRQALRARDARIADLESQVEDHRLQLALLVKRAVARNRAATKAPTPKRKPTKRASAKVRKKAAKRSRSTRP